MAKNTSAEKDLLDIWQYTFAHRDEMQADKYVEELDQRIQLLANNPEMATSRSHLRKGYRVLFINCHAVYHTLRGSTIRTVIVAGNSHGDINTGVQINLQQVILRGRASGNVWE